MKSDGAVLRLLALPWEVARGLGGSVRGLFAQVGAIAWLLLACVRGTLRLRGEQFRVVREVTRTQIRFTALDALPLCTLAALLIGGITLLQVFGQLSGFGMENRICQILAQLVIRELGPLLVGIVVISRSGTAIATEMASRQLSGEIDALYLSGVDPVQYLLVPRLLGGVISLFALIIYFDTVALLGGFAVAWLRLPVSLFAFLGALVQAIGPRELEATFFKALVFGAVIPLLCTSCGLRVRQSTTEIPQAVTRAAVGSLAILLLAGAFLSVLIYGEPLLALEGVSLAAPDGRMVFEGLDWRLARGGRFRLQGGLGTGASALLRLCAGLARPQQGRVVLDGAPLDPDGPGHPFLDAGDLGWVPTDGGLAVNLTLEDNVTLPLRFARKLGRAEAADLAAQWLERAGLARFAKQRPRVPADRVSWLASLARAGAKGSRLWLVDRPAGGLDAASIRAARGMLEWAGQESGVAMVLVGGDWMSALGEELRIEEGRLALGSGA